MQRSSFSGILFVALVLALSTASVAVFGASKSAVAAVEKAGGSVEILAPKRETSEQAA